MLAKFRKTCHPHSMWNKTLLTLPAFCLMAALQATAQNPPNDPADSQKTQDTQQSNRFWQASLPGGHYMVALDRISAVSRHRYVLDGAVIVDEVTVDALGQALARFYFIAPITDAATGSAAGAAASRLAERGTDLLDKAARTAGTDVHQMVIKKFPETTHARTIEYRLLSAEELTALHSSVRTAWESGKGRKFAIK